MINIIRMPTDVAKFLGAKPPRMSLAGIVLNDPRIEFSVVDPKTNEWLTWKIIWDNEDGSGDRRRGKCPA